MIPALGMVVALASEARTLLGRGPWHKAKERLLRRVHLDDDTQLIVTLAGVGVENALAAAYGMIRAGVKALISIGLAGGLTPALKTGDLIIGEEILLLDNGKIQGPWAANPAGIALTRKALAAEGVPAFFGTVLTAPRPILERERKASMFKQTRALAVDMESAAVARAAREKGIPFLTIRAICDPAEETIPPELYDCLNANGKVRLPTLLRNIARKPSLTLDLLRLGRQSAVAGSALKRCWQLQVENRLPHQLVSGKLERAARID